MTAQLRNTALAVSRRRGIRMHGRVIECRNKRLLYMLSWSDDAGEFGTLICTANWDGYFSAVMSVAEIFRDARKGW